MAGREQSSGEFQAFFQTSTRKEVVDLNRGTMDLATWQDVNNR